MDEGEGMDELRLKYYGYLWELMKSIFTVLTLVIGLFVANTQNGEITGKMIDENGEGIPVGNVVIVDSKGVSLGRGTATDFDGNYIIKPLSPGKYNVQFSYIGYETQTKQAVVVEADKATIVDVKLKPDTDTAAWTLKWAVIPDTFKFKLWLEEKRVAIASNYTIAISPIQKNLPRGAKLDATLIRNKSNFIITIHSILRMKNFDWAMDGPFTGRINLGKLPIGNYKLYVIYNSDTATGSIKLRDESGSFYIKSNFASSDGIQKFVRIPSNTLWGYVLYDLSLDSTIVSKYFKLLKREGCKEKKLAPGNYHAFQIDKNRKFITRKTHGWNNEYGFILGYNNSFKKLRDLTRKFIHDTGDDRIDIIIKTDKGEGFNEVR